jgi:hypothetical protein
MNTKITKRQHVVNRKYLSNWENNTLQIFCLDSSGKIFMANSRRICVHNYFYKIAGLTNIEKEYILAIIGEGGREHLIANTNNCSTILELISYMNKLSTKDYPDQLLWIIDSLLFDALSKNFIDSNVNEIPKNFSIKYDNYLKEGVEQVETQFELLGYPFLEKIYKNDIENIDTEIPGFIEYICVQYYRTDALKKHASLIFDEVIPSKFSKYKSQFNLDKIWSISHLSTAIKTINYLLGRRLDIYILKNLNDNKFITGDQPVVNVYGTNNCIEPKDLEFYYPISPTLALTLVNKKGICKRSIKVKEVSSEEVHYLNLLIKKFSNSIYANNREDVIRYQTD